MKKNRLIALSAAAVLSATAVVGGTLAFFTDTDNATNTFTVGNVDIELHEKDKEGNPFVNDQTLVPTVVGHEDSYVEKVVTVENTGSEDAYIWVEILVPADLDNADDDNDSLHLVSGEDVKIMGMGTEEDADGVTYNRYAYYIENGPVAAGATTEAFLDAVYMDAGVTQGTVENSYDLVNGTKDYVGDWNVIVNAYGIQAEGFTNVVEAANAYYGISALQ